jgi:hypothetical protein
MVSWRIPGLLKGQFTAATKVVPDSQSISTDKTLAPSLANKAASGRPTTSDLFINTSPTMKWNDIPIDNGDNLSPGPISIIQHLVVDSQMLKYFDNSEWSTG